MVQKCFYMFYRMTMQLPNNDSKLGYFASIFILIRLYLGQ
jgi:hypothetical protein